MIRHFKYWNKWRKKFPTTYSKWYKFLALIGLKKPYTLRMMIFADKYNGAVVAFNHMVEIFNQTALDIKKAAEEEVGSSEVSKV